VRNAALSDFSIWNLRTYPQKKPLGHHIGKSVPEKKLNKVRDSKNGGIYIILFFSIITYTHTPHSTAEGVTGNIQNRVLAVIIVFVHSVRSNCQHHWKYGGGHVQQEVRLVAMVIHDSPIYLVHQTA
jgi:hypothetical protein